ncbi:MAG TPA: A/G-specific adenine glycosylase [Gammaproteobacteria bacterium]|nr:A/G-specific adenine glycosylase [Gammaproteobacteria bacterium]
MCCVITHERTLPEPGSNQLANSDAETFAPRLLHWFDQFGRKDLPWQHNITPYRVWVSEIMLQQTQVKTVIPYFERFIERFPTVAALADADQDSVLHQWTGLGYYARGRNLHKAALQIVADYNGELPLTVDELCALPGIGRSTAGAIVAICTDQFAVILDGNVKRVLARYLAIDGWPGQTKVANELWENAEALTPQQRVAHYTQAIMDFGATLCTRTKPDCPNCPFTSDCKAHLDSRIEFYPGKKPTKSLPTKTTCMLVITNDHSEVMLEKRPPAGLWGGLWSFPETDLAGVDRYLADSFVISQTKESMAPFRHTFTHFHLEITPIHIHAAARDRVHESDNLLWYSLTQPPAIGLTRPVTRIIDSLEKTHV